jgi:voltage-gated potassium channel
MNIKKIVEDNSCPKGKIFDLTIQALIVFSLVTFSIETVPNISNATKAFLRLSEIATVIVFTIEYLLRIAVADKKLRFIFSFYGLIDIASILPFYLATGLDLRSLRILRMLRLFRAFKLLRYSKAMSRFHRRVFKILCQRHRLRYFSSRSGKWIVS